MTEISYDRIPEHMRGGARRYVEQGILPGSFLTMILENDFVHAASRADDTNKLRLLDYAAWLMMDLPMAAWGSGETVRDWIRSGGLEGQAAAKQAAEEKERLSDAITSE